MNKTLIKSKSHWFKVAPDQDLHVRRIYVNPRGPVVFMLHGAIENGRIFYSKKEKGLAPYLAKNGFDVFVCDLRGRGESHPRINRKSEHGQTENIAEDIPAFVNYIKKVRGVAPQHWMAHSWGGVLMLSALARNPEWTEQIKTMVFLGTKRSIRVFNLEKLLKIDLFWLTTARVIARLYGYLPTKQLMIGADNESRKSLTQSCEWVKTKPWVDSDDGFDYAENIRKIQNLPRMLFLAGGRDQCLGHPADVQDFMREVAAPSIKFVLLSKKSGHLKDYDHLSMMTARSAEKDHFPLMVDWMKNG